MFITLEGVEGSGKTSQMDAIAACLESAGYPVTLTREPGSTKIGGRIRSILLDPDHHGMAPLCELLLYGADRAQHLAQVVRPALEAGETVVCDRFADATRVYQGVVRGVDVAQVEQVHQMVVGNLVPDLTFLFDLDPEIGLARTRRDLDQGLRNDAESRFEKETLSFHAAVRQGYLDLAGRESQRFNIIDASRPQAEVTQQIRRVLADRLGINI